MRRIAWIVFFAAALAAFLPGAREAGRPQGSVPLLDEFEGEKMVAEPLTER